MKKIIIGFTLFCIGALFVLFISLNISSAKASVVYPYDVEIMTKYHNGRTYDVFILDRGSNGVSMHAIRIK